MEAPLRFERVIGRLRTELSYRLGEVAAANSSAELAHMVTVDEGRRRVVDDLCAEIEDAILILTASQAAPTK